MGAVTGIVLGFRFNVLVLIPAMLAAAAVTSVIGHGSGHASSVVVFATLATLASLQVGYFVGCLLQGYSSTQPDEYHVHDQLRHFGAKSSTRARVQKPELTSLSADAPNWEAIRD
jgi:membrane protein DedA with SNARE-associated domain